jgi:hypothetical protein
LAPIAIISGILYLIYTNSERKINISHYWKASKSKLLIDKEVQEEFQRHDQRIKIFKHLLELVIPSRNNVQKGLNELRILKQDITENVQISTDDYGLLKKIGVEIHSIKGNLKQIKTEVSTALTKDFSKMTDSLISILSKYESSIQNILDAPQSTLKNPEFISHEIQIMEKNYSEIIEIHSQLIKKFQTNISELDN